MDTYKVIVKEIDIRGEISQIPYDWKTAIQLVATGRVRTEELVTHVFPLEDWHAAFHMASTGADALRVAIRH